MAILIPTYDLAQKIGKQIEIDAETVGDLIDEGSARFGEEFRRATAHTAIVVNGRAINYLDGRKTRLKKEDTVWFLKASAGG